MAKDFSALLDELKGYDFSGMYNADFLHTWDKTTDELRALYVVAAALRNLRERNISPRIFDSGLAVSLFRDNSTRTRFSFSKATNLLGLQLQDLDEGKSQIAHGETVRETATMISFMADVIGIRDDMYIGKGDAYRRHRHPRRHVHRQGRRLHGRGRRVRGRGLQGRRARPPSHPHLAAVRLRPPDAVLRRHALPHRGVRRPGEPAWQEGRRDLGLLALLRQAAVLPAVAHLAAAALWHGRHAGPPRGLRPPTPPSPAAPSSR